ncbi:hypothetical protein C8Q78DRAFT_684222 [Trametes maxima]|nr:hypothetical protein C8Q78DRAFT_684222 [Trametes maxima]
MAIERGKASVDGNLAATYASIYSFLLKKEHTKAAEALKKAVKDVVVLKDGVGSEGPSLDVIVKEWKEFKAKTVPVKKTNPSESESESRTRRILTTLIPTLTPTLTPHPRPPARRAQNLKPRQKLRRRLLRKHPHPKL